MIPNGDHNELEKLCMILGIPEKELSFEAIRDSFRKICLKHHPQLVYYHLANRTQHSDCKHYYSHFQLAVAAFARLGSILLTQDTNSLHDKNRSAFDWSGKMMSESINCGIHGNTNGGFFRSICPMEPEDIISKLHSIHEMADCSSNGARGKRCLERASRMLDVFISHAEQVDKHTVYVITVLYCMRKHRVKRRYREFLALHETLSKVIDVRLSFPPKKWSKNSPEVLSERASTLSKYIQDAAATLASKGFYSPEMHEFLGIDTLSIRREEELQMVTILDQQQHADTIGEWHIVDEQWLRQWRAFTQSNADFDPPGRITNNRLLNSDGTPCQSMSIVRDYRCVNGDVWALWLAIYGGGPMIVRSSKDLCASAALGRTCAMQRIFRILRSFLFRLRLAKRKKTLKRMTIGDILAAQKRQQKLVQRQITAVTILQRQVRRWQRNRRK